MEAIRSKWEEFIKRVGFGAGNGKRVTFWKHMWCSYNSLEEVFLGLFLHATTKDALFLHSRLGGGQGWELGEVEAFFRRLEGQLIRKM